MSSDYLRIIGAEINAMRRSLGALVGIAQGLMCDGVLSDQEIKFLRQWFEANPQLAYGWPGDVVYDKVKEVLSDGIITDEERRHLVTVLEQLVGQSDADLSNAGQVVELAYDDVHAITFTGRSFCFTGDFVHGSRSVCERDITERGGVVSKGVTKKLHYLVIGSLGSVEWKHGSFGTKIDKAMQIKRAGAADPILVKEAIWRSLL